MVVVAARSSMCTTAGDAVRPFRLLSGRVGADGRAGDDRAGAHDDVAVGADRDREAVHAAWRRAGLLLTDAVVLRTVARALEPLAGRTGRHAQPRCGHFW